MENTNIQNNNNISRFRRRPHNTFPLILFGVIFIYIIIVLIIYLRTTHMVRYEVVEGSLATNTIYRGIIVREESVVNCSSNGYVNYLAREGQRVAVGDLVFTVDETGNLNDYIESQSLGENSLTDKELSEFRSDIINYLHEFDATDFDSVYDFKYSLKNTVLKLANTKLLNNMDEASSDSNSVSLKYSYAPASGIVSYWIDGYEDINPELIDSSYFDEKNYDKVQLLSNTLMSSDDIAYKVSTSEEWSVVFPCTEAMAEELMAENYIKVKFLKNQNESWGKVNILDNSDGTYLELTFSNSMVTFVDERYLDIELELNNEVGLKIPLSSIAEKEFYIIDGSYVTIDVNDNATVLKQTYGEDGKLTASAVSVNIYSYDSDSDSYYIDGSALDAGDILYGSDETTFVVKERGTLIGVYNINKGYADFKEITILYQNDEYAIVKSNTTYGLRVYDYIALEADTASDDQFISQTN